MHLNKIYTWLRHPGESLSQRVVHGGIWVFALRITDRLFGLARTIILARLLAPTDFGLFGIALLAMSALETFSQTGFNAALIQKKEDTKPYLDTAWTVQATRGIFLALILFLIAPYVAAFFEAPAAKPILQVIGLSALLQGFTNIGVIYFQKELEFHKQFVYMFSGTLVNVGVAISAAFLLRSVWALVFGLLAGNLVRMVVSYFIHPYRPRPRLEGAKAKELYTFGKWILGSSIVVFLATQGDDIFLGKVLGVTTLGLYQVAFRFSNLMATEITHVISQVTFPAYSKLQDNIPKLREGFLRTVEATASLSLPLTAGIFILAPDFVRLFLGEKWMPMVPALRILSISGLIRSIAATGVLFRAVGRPSLVFWMNSVRVVVIAFSIYPLTVRYGVGGTAIAVLLGIAGTIPVWWKASSKIVHYSTKKLLRDRLLPSIVGSSLMASVVLVIQGAFNPIGFIEFAGLVASAMISYIACQLLFWRFYRLGLIKTLQTLRRAV